MRFLHTSDWHIGKTLKGHNRLAEQSAVMEEIVGVVRQYEVDAVLIAGDIYDSAAPSAEAQQLLVRTLLEIRNSGVPVIAIAGNHDHAPTFDAYRPLMGEVGIHLVGTPGAGSDGAIEITARSTGESAVIATLPFVSQRTVIRAAELIANTPVMNSISYAQRVEDMLTVLARAFRPDAVNILMAHLTVTGGKFGGGERDSQSVFEYHVPASAFPAEAQYVALGHLHRRQAIGAPCPVHYSGSPISIDFGEQDNESVVCLVEATPSAPAKVTDIPIKSGRRLMTLRGTLAEIESRARGAGDAFLRVQIKEPARAGLLEEVRDLLPNALDIRIDPAFAARNATSRPASSGIERTPTELFAEYCATKNMDDPRLAALFARLHDATSES
ncbi:Exodeoxyribonuclease I subunit D [Micromonospora rhizosphaerae]|uniref:Nuclease SbcCD subunit D n=1 Tax=Micromonospora rhizosphaerae TaxID=568872 RepID=A0A1C6SA02_9ACTN|nr:exonuclease SbcCD subunit D [Micromonospora rhizosphaerae]SCL26171.1 Exodeoxyribonuclease I subunit D [Micromonospora rhizosphaerae]